MLIRSPSRRPGRQIPGWLVATAVVATIVGLLLPAIQKVRHSAWRTGCANNVKQVALAVNNYSSTADAFPPGTMPNPGLPPEQRLSWLMAILPYLEANPYFARTDLSAAWDAEQNRGSTMIRFAVYTCPAADRSSIQASYLGAAGVGPGAATLPAKDPRAGVFGYDRRTKPDDVTDGLSTTLLLFESESGGPWAQGGPGTVRGLDPTERPHVGAGRPFGSGHRGGEAQPFGRTSPGANVATADGAVRFVSTTVTPEVLEALATIAGKEDVPADW